MKLTIVDVFAEHRYEGNQLAVVEDAAALSPKEMQAIAREMNFSETTFVVSARADSAEARIFTPAEELPFAGHPTLGTAWVLGRDRASFELCVPAGNVAVSFVDGLAWMVPPEPELRARIEPVDAKRMVGDDGVELDSEWPAQRVHSGAEYCLVPVATLEALRRVRPDLAALKDFSAGGATFAVCRETSSDDTDFAVRMHFFDGVGLREDPATGSANAAFAAYLRALGLEGRFVVEQGREIGRPSRLYLDVGPVLRVGGRVQLVAEGRLVRGAAPSSKPVA